MLDVLSICDGSCGGFFTVLMSKGASIVPFCRAQTVVTNLVFVLVFVQVGVSRVYGRVRVGDCWKKSELLMV